MKNVLVQLLITASYRLKEWTDPSFYGSPYESGIVYEKPFSLKKYFGFRKGMGFRI